MTTTAKPDRLMTTAEAARVLSLRPQTLHEWRSTGRMPSLRFVKMGAAVRYRESDVQAFIERNTSDAQ